jgi:hypothetical protein
MMSWPGTEASASPSTMHGASVSRRHSASIVTTEWRTILEATKAEWRAAFERRPWSRREAAAGMIKPSDPVSLDECQFCNGPLPPRRRGRARSFCSDGCRKRAHESRLLVA